MLLQLELETQVQLGLPLQMKLPLKMELRMQLESESPSLSTTRNQWLDPCKGGGIEGMERGGGVHFNNLVASSRWHEGLCMNDSLPLSPAPPPPPELVALSVEN